MEILGNLGPSIVFLVVGIILKLWPPKEVNSFYGYRTSFSKKNNDVWKVANSYSGTMMILGAVISIIFSITITFLYGNNPGRSNITCVMGSLIIVLISIFYTEVHLRKVFDKDGKRK
ncbi:SdpI family protein [Clostridium beijerinckii]|uniref:SdpI family protein n=1 Tax=Clostridium beijerinckii TaxID=1520 RepID=A0AAW3WAX8_CLOBE|nr:SdpI family protein [Clostridium beijerinckii]MBC2458561.1 SdpI family protein [Clostridium beijerinckii]MBC2475948.1 SdpI family protein [Clostridium beijerinckii]NOV61046.1 putative membrane protein [Clostridium beijerinckii]NOV72862.1 putative membrane protein [Clostridium beijerinckii]NOW33091.1 putative membrane protein [Clostridium beijerinckii]